MEPLSLYQLVKQDPKHIAEMVQCIAESDDLVVVDGLDRRLLHHGDQTLWNASH